MTAGTARECENCSRALPPRCHPRKKFCDRCRKADPHKNGHRRKKRGVMIVGLDCESASNPAKHHPDLGLFENDMVTFSFGREDGTSLSIKAPEGGFLEPIQVWLFILEHLGKDYTDASGQVWRQELFGFHFNHDTGMLLKGLWNDLVVVHKSTAKVRGLLCGSDHGPEDGCERIHRFNQDDAREILRNGGESDYITWDPISKFGFSSTAGRRLYMEFRPFGDRFEENVRVDIHDVGMAFPGKFESVIDKWQPELRPGDRDIIAWGKAQRKDDFRLVDRGKIAEYSEAECVSLARLIRKFLNTLHEATGLHMLPHKLFGSGSVAGEVLKFNSVPLRKDTHMEETAVRGTAIDDIAQLCYFGGKIEGPTVGLLAEDAHPRDINSAYPAQMVHLPCMRTMHGRWVSKRGKATLSARSVGYALVDWMLPQGVTQFPPFMVRDKNSSVFCPRVGQSTWVTWPEYEAAAEVWGDYIQVRHTVYWVNECDCEPPLGFLAEVYALRYKEKDRAKQAAKDGDEDTYREACAREEVYKLIINSAYGKCAQREPQFGKFTNMHYAAMITGNTRAQVNREVWSGEALGGTPVYVHTDSVTFVGLEREDQGKVLGAWGKEDPKKGLFIIQPGLAIPVESGKAATRGVSKSVIVPFVKEWVEENKDSLEEHPTTWQAMSVTDTRMYSLRQAHHIGKPTLAGSFVTKPQKVGFYSAKREFARAVPMGDANPHAWRLPPKEMIHPDDVAELTDLTTYRNEMRRQRQMGLWDEEGLAHDVGMSA